MHTILHIDFNSFFATVEQQANPRLRGKPVGVTGGDKDPYRSRYEDSIALAHGTLPSPDGEGRMKRTVLGAASVEAKRYGVKTGMQLRDARKLCPEIILVQGDSDKYLSVTKRFLSILKDYSPCLEVFSIDEAFLELTGYSGQWTVNNDCNLQPVTCNLTQVAQSIKSRIRTEIGEAITCSVGISYNKLLAKLAGSLQKPDGLVVIPDQETAIKILDKIELDEVCGVGGRIKQKLFNMGVTSFKQLRQVPLEALLASFKSYGQVLYNMARGVDHSPVIPFYEKEEIKSVGHRHTIDHDTNNEVEIKQILLKLTELVARRLRAKKLVGKTIHCYYREAFQVTVHLRGVVQAEHQILHLGDGPSEAKPHFQGDGMQTTINYTDDGLEIFQAAWKIFHQIWDGNKIRMIGVSVSNLKPKNPENLSLLPEKNKQQVIIQVLDKINDKFGEFTLQRGILLQTPRIHRMPNPFLADRRFKL